MFYPPKEALKSPWFRMSLDPYRNLKPDQNFIRLFLSPETPYRSLLVIHTVGSGKTYAAAALAHDHAEKGRDVIFLAYGVSSQFNFKETYNFYVSNNKLKNYSSRIIMYGFLEFMRRYEDNQDIAKECLYIVDEIHNVRIEADRYLKLQSILKYLPKARFLLLTGTPMINRPEEIDDLRNLFDKDTPMSVRLYGSPVEIEYQGEEKFGMKLVKSKMEGIQLETYKKVGSDEIGMSQRQVSICVSHDGTFGREITEHTEHGCKIKKFIKSLNREEITVVFCEFLSGLRCIGNALKQIGFEEWVYNESDSKNISGSHSKDRYVICDSTTENSKIIEMFNSDRNNDGSIIKVIIGSRVIGESISLNCVGSVHIITPHWNMALITQMIGRCTRLYSHAMIENPKVLVYLHAAILETEESIDMKMYRISLEKQSEINNKLELIDNINMDIECNAKYGDPIEEESSSKRFYIEHNGETWYLEQCFDKNSYKVSQCNFYKDEGLVLIEGRWEKRRVPSCINIKIPKDEGPWIVLYIADNKYRLLWNDMKIKKERRRGQDISTLSSKSFKEAKAEFSNIIMKLNKRPIEDTRSIVDIAKYAERLIENQIVVDCTC